MKQLSDCARWGMSSGKPTPHPFGVECAGILVGLLLLIARPLPGDDTKADADLASLETKWAQSLRAHASDALASILDDTFIAVNAEGIVARRAEYLREATSTDLRIDEFAIERLITRVHGETAVVSMTIGIIGSFQRDISGFYQVTDSFAHKSGEWKALARQATRITSRKDPFVERLGFAYARPRVVLFVQGSFCPHCMTQLVAFAKEVVGRNIDVTVVSADTPEDLKAFPNLPFTLLADPTHALFRRFGAFDGKPLHATLALDDRGNVVFHTAGKEPYMNADSVFLWLEKAMAAKELSKAATQ